MAYPILISVFICLAIGLWVWALGDILQAPFRKIWQRGLMLAVVIILPLLGPLLYFNLKRSLTWRAGGFFDQRD